MKHKIKKRIPNKKPSRKVLCICCNTRFYRHKFDKTRKCYTCKTKEMAKLIAGMKENFSLSYLLVQQLKKEINVINTRHSILG